MNASIISGICGSLDILRNGNVISFQPVGSCQTCDPVPGDTDFDILVLVTSMAEFDKSATEAGWDMGGSKFPVNDFQSYTIWDESFSFDVNLIVTNNPIFYNDFTFATRIAKSLNLLDKRDRIKLFQAILYGKI